LRFADSQLDALETLASIEATGGRPSAALHMLTVVDRERRPLGGAALNVDRRRMRSAALAAARGALSRAKGAGGAVAAARLTGREDLVASHT
jgi:hypothetical protein